MKTRYFDPPYPRLFGHRGSAVSFPENTIPSFQAALNAGVPYLEMDVWATCDGHIVVHHDKSALRTCGSPLKITELKLTELKKLDAGFTFSPDGGKSHPFRGKGITIPTLEEVFQIFPQALFNIEIKQDIPAIEELTVESIRRAEKEDAVLLAAEKDAVMQKVRRVCQDIPTSLSYEEVAVFYDWVRNGCSGKIRTPGKALQIPEIYGSLTLVTQETVQAAHDAGLEVHVWTVNDPMDMKKLLAMGVDGIMSDAPKLLVKVAKTAADGGP
jgi:glycerophosphoryl diester phosphodiesterase